MRIGRAPGHLDAGVRPSIVSGGALPPRRGHGTLGDALVQAAASPTPRSVIFIVGGGETRVGYPALLTSARRVWRGLADVGLRAGDTVVLQVPETPLMVAALWGCFIGGVAAVLLPVPKRYAEDDGAALLLRTASELLPSCPVIASTSTASRLQAAQQTMLPRVGRVQRIEELLRSGSCDSTPPAQPDLVAVVQFTSGSTGEPKCVRLTHRNLISTIDGHSGSSLFRDVVSVCWTSLDHISGMIWHLRGACLNQDQVIASPEAFAADPLSWLDWLHRYRANITRAPNFAYELVSRALGRGLARPWDLSGMCAFFSGAEPTNPATCRRFAADLAPYGLKPGRIFPAYGLTESCGGVVYGDDPCDSPAGTRLLHREGLGVGAPVRTVGDEHPQRAELVKVGRPIPGVVVRIVDDDGSVVDEETVGHVQMCGEAIAAQPDAATGDWLATGDIGFIADGILILTGRDKDVIIVRGRKLPAQHLEEVVRALPGVDPSCVGVCRAKHPDGHSETPVVVFSSKRDPAADVALGPRIKLAVAVAFGCTPIVVEVPASAFPHTRNGKLSRAALQKAFDSGQFSNPQPASRTTSA